MDASQAVTAPVTLPTPGQLGEVLARVWAAYLDGDLTVLDHSGLGSPGHLGGTAAPRMLAAVSITGAWAGHLQVSVSPECTRQLAAGLWGGGVVDLSTTVLADALGEVANMVGGTVKSTLGDELVLSLPQVVLDAAALISVDAEPRVQVAARWRRADQGGAIDEVIEVSLWQRRSTSRARAGQQ